MSRAEIRQIDLKKKSKEDNMNKWTNKRNEQENRLEKEQLQIRTHHGSKFINWKNSKFSKKK